MTPLETRKDALSDHRSVTELTREKLTKQLVGLEPRQAPNEVKLILTWC